MKGVYHGKERSANTQEAAAEDGKMTLIIITLVVAWGLAVGGGAYLYKSRIWDRVEVALYAGYVMFMTLLFLLVASAFVDGV